MAQSQSTAGTQLSSSATHDVELAASRDQQPQHEHNERTRLLPKKQQHSSNYQHSDEQQASHHAAAAGQGPYSDTYRLSHTDSHLHLPEPLNHVAENLQEEFHQVADAAHDYIVKHHRGITTFLVAITRILEATDATLLPAVYFYVGCAFNATPAQLGSITFTRLLVSSFAAPFGGLLGHKYNRVKLVACACWYWAFCTVLFAASNSTAQGTVCWAFNGIGLGIMIPNAQSLVADFYDATHRGRAFGMLLAVGNLGSMLSSAYATNIAGLTILGIQGWRFAFITVAAISCIAGAAMWIAAKDPRCSRGTWQLDERFRHLSSSSSSTAAVPDRIGSSRKGGVGAVAAVAQQRKASLVTSSSEGTAAAAAVGSRDQQQQQQQQGVRLQYLGSKSATAATAVAGESESSSLLSGCAAAAAAAAAAEAGGGGEGGGRRLGLYGRLERVYKSDLAQETWVVLSTPSFIVVVVQGFLGSMPWGAFAFTTLYLQLQGWSDMGASAIMAVFSCADAFGAFFGGVVGDWAAARFPDHGRIAACQFSVGIGVPLCLLIFQGLPLGSSTGIFLIRGAVYVCMGLLISWAATACNNPIFAEIVPPHLRTLVYAFDRCLEGALSAIGAPMVGVTAQRLFHFSGAAATQDCTSGAHTRRHRPDFNKARALGNALTLFSTVPWTLCCLVYTLLHWTYPKDRRRGSCTGMPIEDVKFSPLPRSDDFDLDRNRLPGLSPGFSHAAESANDLGFVGPDGPLTPGLLDKIDQYISHPTNSVLEVPEIELQETGMHCI